MSKIATALALSRGEKISPKQLQAAIIPSIIPKLQPLAPSPAAKKPRHRAVIVGGIALCAAVGWWVFPTNPPVSTAPAPQPATTTQPVTALALRVARAPDDRMAPEIEDQLRKLPIGARRAGQAPRIVVSGKIVEPGDTVIPDVVLESVFPDRVVFRNAQNQHYERRF